MLVESFIIETESHSVLVSQNRLGDYSVSVYKKLVRHGFSRVDTINETNERFNSFIDAMSFIGQRLRLQ